MSDNNPTKEELIAQMSPRLKEVYDNVAEPYIAIDVAIAEQELSLLTSKYGGVPYIPENEDCLRDENGYPYLLFAQFNFSEIAEQAGQHSDLPTQGLLQIFLPIFNTEIFLHDKDFDTSKCVRFYPELPTQPANEIVINEIRNLWKDVESLWDINSDEYANLLKENCKTFEVKYPKSNCYMPFYREINLTFSQKIGRPYQEDIVYYTDTEPYSRHTLTSEEWDLYAKIVGKTSGNKLLGFGNYCQGDPRYIYTYKNKKILGNLRLFFQLDGSKWERKENGRGYRIVRANTGEFQFFIDKQDLKNQNFSNMMFYFACT